ncbi:MAG: hypothetical protein A2901_00965 [Elusimicrobia bacterium RIFCSPLOWO2_01_FULL_54_10]|nr:MAG: hypothetical protein A2901_00965 [Elusimicrobia bacterium RIFCSPLOWO2_01_FULL_54_10]
MPESWPQTLGLIGALCMPLCNIPMIARIVKRKSSDDISLAWVFGVEICVLFMVPSAILSADPVLRIFGITNAFFFSIVTVVVWIYHRR